MAAPILWAPKKTVFFLQENLHVHKIPRFGGQGVSWLGGGSADFIFMGAGFFRNKARDNSVEKLFALEEVAYA